jgi:hypothetical protein
MDHAMIELNLRLHYPSTSSGFPPAEAWNRNLHPRADSLVPVWIFQASRLPLATAMTLAACCQSALEMSDSVMIPFNRPASTTGPEMPYQHGTVLLGHEAKAAGSALVGLAGVPLSV